MIKGDKKFTKRSGLTSLLALSALAALVTSAAVSGPSQAAKQSSPKALRLMEKNGCLNCHYVQGDGGFIAPPLDGISRFRKKDDLVKMLTSDKVSKTKSDKEEQSYPSPEELMSHVKLGQKDALEIVDYLMTLPADENFEVKGHGEAWKDIFPLGSKFVPEKTSKSSQKGKKLFYKNGCIACHIVEGKGGRSGPCLDGIGASRSRKFIEKRIESGAVVVKCGTEYAPSNYSMPPSTLSRKAITKITNFLMTLPPDPREN